VARHDPEAEQQVQRGGHVDAQEQRDRHQGDHRRGEEREPARLLPCEKRRRDALLLRQGAGQVDQRGQDDHQADAEREVARLGADLAPADAELQRALDDDRAEDQREQGKGELERQT
jgi:hypothetical protein